MNNYKTIAIGGGVLAGVGLLALLFFKKYNTIIMKVSQKGKDLIKEFESFEPAAYLCPAQVWTIGWGHTKGVKQGQTVTKAQAEELLSQDLQMAENIVLKEFDGIQLSQNQFDALASFAFNMKGGFTNAPTLKNKVRNNPNDKTIREAFALYNKGGGVVLNGLVRRRNAEANLYFA